MSPAGDFWHGLLHPDLMGPNRPGPKGFRDLTIGIDGLYLGGAGCHGGPGITVIPATTPITRCSTTSAEPGAAPVRAVSAQDLISHAISLFTRHHGRPLRLTQVIPAADALKAAPCRPDKMAPAQPARDRFRPWRAFGTGWRS